MRIKHLNIVVRAVLVGLQGVMRYALRFVALVNREEALGFKYLRAEKAIRLRQHRNLSGREHVIKGLGDVRLPEMKVSAEVQRVRENSEVPCSFSLDSRLVEIGKRVIRTGEVEGDMPPPLKEGRPGRSFRPFDRRVQHVSRLVVPIDVEQKSRQEVLRSLLQWSVAVSMGKPDRLTDMDQGALLIAGAPERFLLREFVLAARPGPAVAGFNTGTGMGVCETGLARRPTASSR